MSKQSSFMAREPILYDPYPWTNILRSVTALMDRIKARRDVPSIWLISPYFLLYFIMYIVNTLVWPLQVMERSCKHVFSSYHYNLSVPVVSKTSTGALHTKGSSCIETYMKDNSNHTIMHHGMITSHLTLHIMIYGSLTGGVIAIASYFLVWRPLIRSCQTLAIFLPPFCMICQTVLMEFSQNMANFTKFKYALLSSFILPSLHCNFQGMMLLAFHMSEVTVIRSNKMQKTINARLEASHMVIMTSILFAGSLMAAFFSLQYNYLFFIQITLGCVCLIYALTLLPTSCVFTTAEENDNDLDEYNFNDDLYMMENTEDNTYHISSSSSRRDRRYSSTSLISSSSSSDGDEVFEEIARNRTFSPVAEEIFKSVPMNFAETSHKKKWIIIIEICMFTIAMISDTSIVGPYLIRTPISIETLGFLLVVQGIMKIFGVIFIKFAVYFFQLKHGSLICLSAINYIGYYIGLSFGKTRMTIIGVMFSNLLGGIAFPTLYSFIKLNLKTKVDTVLEMGLLSSLIVTMCFNPLEYFIFERTKEVFPGAVFLLTASIIVVCIAVIWMTHMVSMLKAKRYRSKHMSDILLKDMQ